MMLQAQPLHLKMYNDERVQRQQRTGPLGFISCILWLLDKFLVQVYPCYGSRRIFYDYEASRGKLLANSRLYDIQPMEFVAFVYACPTVLQNRCKSSR